MLLVLTLLVSCKDRPADRNECPQQEKTTGYLHASGTLLYDGEGNELLLKGLGLGGWMLQEGYMLGTSGPQHKIRQFLEDLAGKSAVDKFYEDWLTWFVTEEDVDQIAAWGYNSVRLPLHYNLFFDEHNQWLENSKGIELTDNLLTWCKKNNLYLILDLHVAPGGQGNLADIVDKRDGESLWRDEKYQEMTVLMWKKLAERYANEKWIGGYDLLNEPNYDFEDSGSERGCNCLQNEPLTSLYKRMIDAIREVDKNHLIILEGNCMGGNYNGMEELATYDPQNNLALSFHGYWEANTSEKISNKLDLRNSWNVPLWRGEIGENSNTWFTDMVILMDQHRIGWANWPWKKINTLDGPVLIEPIPEWDKVIAYKANSNKPRPTTEEAQTALVKMIEGIKLKNCRLMHDVSYAYINAPQGEGSKPYAEHVLPSIIHFTDYDYGKYNETWYDADYQNISGVSSNTAWNKGEVYRNDGVDIWKTKNDSSPLSNGYYVGDIQDGEWMQYTLREPAEGTFGLSIRARSRGKSTLSFWLDDEKVKVVQLTATGNNWKTLPLGEITFRNNRKIKVLFETGDCEVAFMKFD